MPDLSTLIAQIPVDVTPANAQQSMRVMQSAHEEQRMRFGSAPLEPTRVSYGAHERQVLDVFAPADASGAPVVVFVHGGNFVAGHAEVPGTPFYGNVGRWAAARGWVGVVLTYRLAPEAMYPEGTDDVARALTWVLDEIGAYGGDSRHVVAVGTSAGGIHLALALQRSARLAELSGLGFVSCLYDLTAVPRRPVLERYFGAEVDLARIAPIGALERCAVPILLTVAERDPADHQQQFDHAVHVLRRRDEPLLSARLADHNHFSAVLGLGLEPSDLGNRIADLVAAGAGARALSEER